LVEPATFLLFVLGWLVLPGSPRNWTIAIICILFVPAWFEFLFALVRSVAEKKKAVAGEALSSLFTNNFSVLLSLIFLAHQTLVSLWLDLPPQPLRNEASDKDKLFLRRPAIKTWRYLAEFSTEQHNWLIPDNVQEDPYRVAARVSPTNLGFLLNARQVACEFGYLTAPEFAELT